MEQQRSVKRMFDFDVPFDKGFHPQEIQKWMKENGVSHGPTVKNYQGWKFTILVDEDLAMAFKLTWT